jgi:hypothetical protein
MNSLNTFDIFNIYSDDLINEIDKIDNFIKSNNLGKKSNHCDFWLLDTTQTTFSLLEKYIYDIAMFQFKNLNIEFDSNKYYIEFWWRNDASLNNFHIDCDENERALTGIYKLPLLSNVVYFNETLYPTILTNVDLDHYKYKDFENNTTLCISLPKKGKLVSFNSSYYHGVSNIFKSYDNNNRSTLMINLWEHRPKNEMFYSSKNILHNTQNSFNFYSKTESLLQISKNDSPTKIKMDAIFFYHDFMEDLLYNKKYDILLPCGDKLIELYGNDIKYNNSTFEFYIDKYKKEEINLNLKTDNLKSNNLKYKQRMTLYKTYNNDICKWIINEATKSNLYFNKIELEDIQNIFSYVLISVKTIMQKICDKYCLNNIKNQINISELCLIKNTDMFPKIDYKDSLLSFIILLNNTDEFKGGDITFDDEITHTLELGDVFIFDGKTKHSFSQVTTGQQYVLFCNLNLN